MTMQHPAQAWEKSWFSNKMNSISSWKLFLWYCYVYFNLYGWEKREVQIKRKKKKERKKNENEKKMQKENKNHFKCYHY